MLLEYVRAIVERKISEQEQAAKLPQCLLTDILNEAREDITECMRAMIRNGEYTGGITINKIPMLMRKKS